jgi:hypothetical protein
VYNLRYHIASLVAVFLALSLGLLLGGITVQSGVVTRQRAALVQSLRTDYGKLKTQNQTLNQDLDLEKRLSQSMVDAAIAERLKGKSVLVLTNAGQVEGLSATEAAIRDADGTPVIVTLDKPRLGLDDSAVTTAVAAALGTAPEGDLLPATTKALAEEWATGAPGPVTKALVDSNVFDAPDVPAAGFGGVVDLTTFDGKADPGALAVAVELQNKNKAAVGGQPRGSKSNLAAEANAEGLGALDTLGTEAGRYTLVALLSGLEPGFYGVGQGTIAPFPDPAEVPAIR